MAGAIGFKVKFKFKNKKVRKLAKTASERNLFRAAGAVRTFTRRSLLKSKKPSAPGRPPTVGAKPFFTFKGKRITPKQAERIKKTGGTVIKKTGDKAGRLKKAILFNVNARSLTAIIGPKKSIVGIVGQTHEFGKRFRGKNFPKRPFQRPALVEASQNEKIAKFWRDSIRAI